MDLQEAKAWLRGERSMTNIIPREPYETWNVRISQADAACVQEAYWIAKAHHDDIAQSKEATEIQALRDRVEKLETFANDVLQWAGAYPKRVFTEPTPEQVHSVCKSLGVGLDQVSAMVLRVFVKPWGDKAAEALKEKDNV